MYLLLRVFSSPGEDAVTYRASNGDLLKYDIVSNQTVLVVDGEKMVRLITSVV